MTSDKECSLRPLDCPPLLKPIPDTFSYSKNSKWLIPSFAVKSPVFASAAPYRKWPVVFPQHKLIHKIKSLPFPKFWHTFLREFFPSSLLSILQATFMCIRACTCHEVYLIIKMASLGASLSGVEISKFRILLLSFSHVCLWSVTSSGVNINEDYI